MIRRVVKTGNDDGTKHDSPNDIDKTIMAVAILFIIILAIINVILFAVRR